MTPDARLAGLVLITLVFTPGCDGPPPPIQTRASLVGHSREVSSIAFAPDGKTLASRGADAVRLWDVAGGREVASFGGDGTEMGSVTFSPDGATVAANQSGVGAMTWDVASKAVRVTYPAPFRPEVLASKTVSHAWGLAYSPDGKTLAGGVTNGGEGGFLLLWEVDGNVAPGLEMKGGPVTSVAISPDGKTLAAKNLGESIVLWDLATLVERRSIRVGQTFGVPVAFSPDGKTLASADDNRRVRLWDVATGRDVASLKWHLKAILSVAYHPDGKRLASGDSGGVILLWDLPSRRPIARFEGPQGKVWGLAFSPDGKTLAAGGEDRTVRLWDVPAP